MIFLVDTLGFGGSERTVQILANNIRQRVTIISIANQIKYDFKDNTKIICLLRQNYSGVIKLLLFPILFIRILVILKNINPQEVISFHFFSNVLNVLISQIIGYKSFISERQFAEKYFGKRNIILKPIIRTIYNKCNGIICNDIEIKESLRHYYSIIKPIYVLNNLFVPPDYKLKLIKKRSLDLLQLGG